MNGQQFVRRARRYARKQGLSIHFDPSQGKGSHGMLYVGDHKSTVPHGEIGRGLLAAMLKQLGINPREF